MTNASLPYNFDFSNDLNLQNDFKGAGHMEIPAGKYCFFSIIIMVKYECGFFFLL